MKLTYLKNYSLIIILSLSFSTIMVSPSSAEVNGPGWFMETAEPVSPIEAKSYYDSKALKDVSAESSLPATISAFSSSSAVSASVQITELARALRNDPKLIYDYVHNHIDYVPYFGALKGPGLTLLNGKGNDFDQASLMVAQPFPLAIFLDETS